MLAGIANRIPEIQDQCDKKSGSMPYLWKCVLRVFQGIDVNNTAEQILTEMHSRFTAAQYTVSVMHIEKLTGWAQGAAVMFEAAKVKTIHAPETLTDSQQNSPERVAREEEYSRLYPEFEWR